jgi:hypothetical protein
MNIIEAYKALQEGKWVCYHSGHRVRIHPDNGYLTFEHSDTALVATAKALQEDAFYVKKQKVKKWRWVMGTVDGKLDNLEVTTYHYSEEDKERLGLLQKIEATEIEVEEGNDGGVEE